MSDRLTVLIGTTKGVFLLTGDGTRESWTVDGPHCDGWPINHVIGDGETGQLWAAGGGEWHGAGIWRSDDGRDWTLTQLADGKMHDWLRRDPGMAEVFGVTLGDPGPFSGEIENIWSLGRAGSRVLAGAKPATLLESVDCGATWVRNEALSNHPSADSWFPGAAGLTLHTIVTAPDDPGKLWLGISAAGVFATESGGSAWERRNRLSNAPASDNGDGQTSMCVHNMVRAPGEGDVLFQQNHNGVFRSRDGGRSWDDITAGLPSDFGFPIAVHPRDPDRIWVMPLNGDSQGRFPPGASAAVWTSTDGGETWRDQRAGLPPENCYFTVLRQAMATDRRDPVGVYFGTNSGSVFATRDEGETWHEVARHLPTVLSVEVLDGAAT